MIDYSAIWDISVPIGDASAAWPGDPPYRRELVMSLADGDVADTSMLHLTAHTGTHLDTPAHFIASGANLDDFGVGQFLLPAVVIASDDPTAVRAEDLRAVDLRSGQAVLFRTRNSAGGRIGGGAFFGDGVTISPAAAELCVERGAALVGIDYPTVDRVGGEGYPVHGVLLGAEIRILESIDLSAVAPGEYTLVCLPLKLPGAEASPVRAVLLR